MDFWYSFPAVKGRQAGRDYYISMVPLKMLSKLFPEDEEYISPEYRAQRRLNFARIPNIVDYILKNRNSYVFSALAASIDGKFNFENNGCSELGILKISLDAIFLINDGQHRKAALLCAIKEDDTLLEETIPIVFFEDSGLSRSQQMFTDLNKYAVKTSNSIAELYDSRDKLAVSTRNAISQIYFLNKYTDKEKDNLGKFSSNLFTLNTFYMANKAIYSSLKNKDQLDTFLYKFWNSVVSNMQPWMDLEKGEITKTALRENFIATQGIVIQALGKLGAYYANKKQQDQNIEHIEKLKHIDWNRSATSWKNRAIKSNGRIIANTKAVLLVSNLIKQKLGIKLSNDEQAAENIFKRQENINE